MSPETKKALLLEATILETRGRQMIDEAQRYRAFLSDVRNSPLPPEVFTSLSRPSAPQGSSASGGEARESKAARIIRIAGELIDSSPEPVPSRVITERVVAAGVELGPNGQNIVASTLSRSAEFDAVGRAGYVRKAPASHENEAPSSHAEGASEAEEAATSSNDTPDFKSVLG